MDDLIYKIRFNNKVIGNLIKSKIKNKEVIDRIINITEHNDEMLIKLNEQIRILETR